MWPGPWMMHKRRGLRMWVLSILSSAPKNGVELMGEIESMTRGWWRPSPGSVYPLLEELTREGFLRKREDGRYELTAKASEKLDWSFGPPFRRPQTVEDMVTEIRGYVSYLEDLSKADRAKVAPFLDAIRDVGDRLSNLAKAKR